MDEGYARLCIEFAEASFAYEAEKVGSVEEAKALLRYRKAKEELLAFRAFRQRNADCRPAAK